MARRQSLWYDELFTAEVAPVPLAELVRAVLAGEGTTSYLQGVPPSYNAPYDVVVHLWLALTRLPADDLGPRLLSLLAAVAAVAVLTAAVTRLAGRAVGLTAGLLAATNPLVVEYAAEARGYGLALLATAVPRSGWPAGSTGADCCSTRSERPWPGWRTGSPCRWWRDWRCRECCYVGGRPSRCWG